MALVKVLGTDMIHSRMNNILVHYNCSTDAGLFHYNVETAVWRSTLAYGINLSPPNLRLLSII